MNHIFEWFDIFSCLVQFLKVKDYLSFLQANKCMASFKMRIVHHDYAHEHKMYSITQFDHICTMRKRIDASYNHACKLNISCHNPIFINCSFLHLTFLSIRVNVKSYDFDYLFSCMKRLKKLELFMHTDDVHHHIVIPRHVQSLKFYGNYFVHIHDDIQKLTILFRHIKMRGRINSTMLKLHTLKLDTYEGKIPFNLMPNLKYLITHMPVKDVPHSVIVIRKPVL